MKNREILFPLPDLSKYFYLLSYQTSKLKTADYLYRYRGIKIEVTAIYRFLDKLARTHKESVEKVALNTLEQLKNISVVFYAK